MEIQLTLFHLPEQEHWTRGNGLKLKQEGFRLKVLYSKGGEHRPPREGVVPCRQSRVRLEEL